jgi:acetylornithine deacetylase
MADLVREVLGEVDRLSEELVEMCRSLVRINTVNPYAGAGITGSELDGQLYLEPIMQGLGGRTRLFEPPPDLYARMGVVGPKDRSWADRPNLVTEFDLGPGKRILINSHMDTVGVADMRFDPFCADLREGKIYGRGTTDDKGGMAMAVIAIKAVLAFADALTGSIVHESVVDEECSGGGAGTLACILEGYTGDEAIVIDGQELLVTRGCQGVLTAVVNVQGKGGHAALGGVNAIDKAIHVKQAIDQFKAAREAQFPNRLVNIGIFDAGSHAAVVPGSARMALNIVYGIDEAAANERAGCGWNGSLLRKEFEDVVHDADASDPFLREHPSTVEWEKDVVPFETPADAPVVRNLTAAYEAATGETPAVDIMHAWADCANIARYDGTPVVLFGAGTKHAAHSNDETVEVADLIRGAKVIAVYLCQQLAK